jgi:Carbon monoxide dehydrogenase subunit G (CoxG)
MPCHQGIPVGCRCCVSIRNGALMAASNVARPVEVASTFSLPVPAEQAWPVLLDAKKIVPCIPGASLAGFDGETITGQMKIKLGPLSLTYKGDGQVHPMRPAFPDGKDRSAWQGDAWRGHCLGGHHEHADTREVGGRCQDPAVPAAHRAASAIRAIPAA